MEAKEIYGLAMLIVTMALFGAILGWRKLKEMKETAEAAEASVRHSRWTPEDRAIASYAKRTESLQKKLSEERIQNHQRESLRRHQNYYNPRFDPVNPDVSRSDTGNFSSVSTGLLFDEIFQHHRNDYQENKQFDSFGSSDYSSSSDTSSSSSSSSD